MTIPFIYFDLGNVLVHFDPEIACRQVASVLDCDPSTIQWVMYDSGLEVELESGKITEAEFLNRLFAAVGRSGPKNDVLHAMSAMFWLNTSITPVVAKLAACKYPMGILSNTCRPHWNWILQKNYGLIRLIGSRTVLSYEIGGMKPERAIYSAAQQIAGTAPSQIIFIDDRPENIQGAIDAGWTALHFTGTDALVRDLRGMGFRCFV